MKRIIALLLCICMALSLAACGKRSEPSLADGQNTVPVADPSDGQSVAESLDEMSREDKELIAELIGGQNANGMTDEELDVLIEDLIYNQDATAVQPPESEDQTAGQPEVSGEPPVETPAIDTTETSDAYDENGAINKPFDEIYPELIEEEKVTFSGETILIKLASDTLTTGLKAAGVGALEQIVPLGDVAWYEAKLTEGTDPKTALADVRELDEVLVAEFNYEVQVAALDEYKHFDKDKEEEFQKNGHNKDQWHFHYGGIVDAYKQMTTQGGDPGVVVAVIDSGVDYNHEDLKDNMWVNAGEIPDNGIDDDGNGYVDDYYGVDIVAGSGSGDDTNGHGTHVAGIIAARNNNTGVLGIAYNVKIMSVKAAAHNGTLNQGDIAKAVMYAYENGAEVINMSFGSTSSSIAVQDALAVAYERCVLVASAGNSGAPNEGLFAMPNYPAALSYVLGVMSVDQYGKESLFTNYDVLKYNGVEYELYAPGENIMSTLPGNQYGYLSGTSMAAPVVSAYAAILRSEFTDRDKYPTKFIYGQLASTSENYADCLDPEAHGEHNLPQVANLYTALTKLPKPELNLQDYALFDDPALSKKNNGDGVIDAGETIALGLTLRNRWGMSENTVVTIDTKSAATGQSDPYITMVTDTVNFNSVGTYSTKDCGKIFENDQLVGWEHPFVFTVAEDCPNDYRITLNVTITCENGLDESDTTDYAFRGTVNEAIRSGCVLPAYIDEDMELTKDSLYIISNATVIRPGVTVRVEPGTRIQFWSDDPNDPYAEDGIAYLIVEGALLVEGSREDPVYLSPSELKSNFAVDLYTKNNGYISLQYADVTNLHHFNAGSDARIDEAIGCTFRQNYGDIYYRYVDGGVVRTTSSGRAELGTFGLAEKCVFKKVSSYLYYGTYDTCVFSDCSLNMNMSDTNNYRVGLTMRNCVFLGNIADYYGYGGDNSALSLNRNRLQNLGGCSVAYNSMTGTTYVAAHNSDYSFELLPYIRSLGGDFVVFNTQEEFDWVRYNLNSYSYYNVGVTWDRTKGCHVMADGSPLPDFIPVKDMTEGYTGRLPMYLSPEASYFRPASCSPCLYEIPGKVLPESIQFGQYVVSMDTQSTLQLQPLSYPVLLGLEDFLYESSNENVLTVSETGLVTPVGLGKADVRVYSLDRAVMNYVTIEVREYVALESVSFPMETAELAVGDTLPLKCVLTPADTTRTTLEYTSSDPTVATVDAAGNVTGVGSGTAVITAVSPEVDGEGNPISASMTVSVYLKASDLHFANGSVKLTLAGDPVDLPALESSNNGDLDLSWRITDEKVAAIEEGKLVPKALGTTYLIAADRYTGLTASCRVMVVEGENTCGIKDMRVNSPYHLVLLEDGRLYEWDQNYRTTPTLLRNDVQQILSLNSYACLLLKDGTIVSCGLYNSNPYDYWRDETLVGRDWKIRGVYGYGSSNPYNFFVITDTGTYAWGRNASGSLGIGAVGTVTEPTLVNLDGVVDIADYENRTLFLTDRGELYVAGSWRDSEYAEPTRIATDVAQIDKSGDVAWVTRQGEWKCWYSYNSSPNTAWSTDLSGMDQVSLYGGNAAAIRDGRVYTCSWDNPLQPVSGVANAVKVTAGSGGIVYIATADGDLLAVGPNNSDNNHIPGAPTGTVIQPTLIPLEPLAEEFVTLLSTNLTEALKLQEDRLVLTFNKIITGATVKLYQDNSQITVNKAVENYNELVITRTAGFTAGQVYRVEIPAGSITTDISATNADDIVFEFAYDPQEQDNEEPVDPEVPEEPEEEIIVHESVLDPTIERHLTTENIQRWVNKWLAENQINWHFIGNAILNPLTTNIDVSRWLRAQAPRVDEYEEVPLGGNWWGTTNEFLIGKQIIDANDFPIYARVMYAPYLTEAPEHTFPFATSVQLFNKYGEEVTTVGNEEVTFRVTFNRDMDTSIPLKVCFGSSYPYAEYEIPGEYVNPRTWEGTYTLRTTIENGEQYFTIYNGCSATDELELQMDRGRFRFEIDTTAAQALIMQGAATDTGIQLKWTQDDFDTLMGYNVYRSTSEDGYYERLNKTVIPANTMEWFDDAVEPGVVYYYNFTVVQTDLTESVPSGKIVIMSKDTMAPNIYHSPVASAFTGANLMLNAIITDNLSVSYANLYYRVAGTDTWTTVRMNKLNEKYSAIIPAANVTVDGIEYYIEAFDGVSFTYKGSAENPFTVVVKQAIDANALGDVDGDGAITIKDAMLLLYAINDKCNLTDEQFARADLNGDGKLWAAEALRILQYVNGVVGSLKM